MSDLEVWTHLLEPTWIHLAEKIPDPSDADRAAALRSRTIQHMGSLTQGHQLTALVGCGASMGDPKTTYTGPSMADLLAVARSANKFAEAKSICGHKTDPPDIEEFLSECERVRLLPTLAKESSGKLGLTDTEKEELGEFLGDAKKKIRDRCDFLIGTIPTGKSRFPLESHKKFLRCFARRSGRKPRLKIFTTNYDLCFEAAASQTGFVVLDGFSFSLPRRFSSLHYGLEIVQRASNGHENLEPIDNLFQLFKLHGSVNWNKSEVGVELQDTPTNPCFIHPAITKYQQAFEQPYLEMVSHYLEALRHTDQTLIVIGFGFADSHLTTPIQSALESSNKFRLVVVDPCLKEKLEKGDGFYGILSKWKSENDDRLTLINGTFEEFMALVPRVHKPTDAERLAETVQKLARQASTGSKP